MRSQNTEEYVKHCFPNDNNNKIKCRLKIQMRFSGTMGRMCKSLQRFSFCVCCCKKLSNIALRNIKFLSLPTESNF